ncbi:MAG TPA: hypothetical protein VGE51_04390 [Fontimonas sp.]
MDLLELPVGLLGWADAQIAPLLPRIARLILWSAAAGALTMLIYAALSPQQRIRTLKSELLVARRDLDQFDGEFADAWPRMRRMLSLAFRQLGLVIGPAGAALAPMVLVVGWIAQTYGYVFPAQLEQVAVRTEPALLSAQLIPAQGQDKPRVALTDLQGRGVGEIEWAEPRPVLEKRTWQAALAGSPLGWLPDQLPVDRIELQLPQTEYLSWGPGWMRGWEFTFFTVLTLVALSLKRVLHLQ